MYTANVKCTVFSALRLALVSAILWLVHVMALYRKYNVPQNAPLLKKANLLEGLEAVAKSHIIKAYLVT